MKQIIKKGYKHLQPCVGQFEYQIKCKKCGSVFSYTSEDLIDTGYLYVNDNSVWEVKCPVCGEQIEHKHYLLHKKKQELAAKRYGTPHLDFWEKEELRLNKKYEKH